MCAPLIPGFSSGIELQLVTAGAVSILWLTRYPGAEYELRLILFCGQLEFRRLNTICGCLKSRRLDSSYDWVELRLLDTSYSWLHPMAESYGWFEFQRLDTSCGCLKFRRMDTSYDWLHPTADSSSGGWIAVATDSILRLTLVPAARYELRLILSCGWLEFQPLDTSCSWLCPTADSSSSGWIRVTADSILRLTRVPAARHDLQLIHPAADYELWLILFCS